MAHRRRAGTPPRNWNPTLPLDMPKKERLDMEKMMKQDCKGNHVPALFWQYPTRKWMNRDWNIVWGNEEDDYDVDDYVIRELMTPRQG